jgi:hypothetical protein
VCGPCGGTTSSSSTTTTGASSSSSTGTGGGCALYGQQCMTTGDCCNNVPCNDPGGATCAAPAMGWHTTLGPNR